MQSEDIFLIMLTGSKLLAQLGNQPGDEFEIKLLRKQIRWVPAGAIDEGE